MLEYCLDRHKTRNMYKMIVDAYPLILRCVPGLFVASEMFNDLENTILDNTDLDNANLDEGFTWYSVYKQCKACEKKIDNDLMSIAEKLTVTGLLYARI